MAIHGSLFTEYQENPSADPFVLQNKKMLKISMAYGPVWARTGSMVAYQGDVRFENTGSGGLNKMLKAAVTGEGVKVMRCTGSGELFVADTASEIQLFYLENDMVSVNGNNVRLTARHRLCGRDDQGRPGRTRRLWSPDFRRCTSGRVVDQWGVHGHPGGHRRPRVHVARRHWRNLPDGLRGPGVCPGAAQRISRRRRSPGRDRVWWQADPTGSPDSLARLDEQAERMSGGVGQDIQRFPGIARTVVQQPGAQLLGAVAMLVQRVDRHHGEVKVHLHGHLLGWPGRCARVSFPLDRHHPDPVGVQQHQPVRVIRAAIGGRLVPGPIAQPE